MNRMWFGVALGLVLCCLAAPIQASITLPDPDPPNNSLIYGDFAVYSLGFLNNIATGNERDPKGPYYKSSTLGKIQDDVIIGIDNVNPQSANVPVMNDPYSVPSGAGSGGGAYDIKRYFSTGIYAHPPAAGNPDVNFLSDTASTWNAQLGSLVTQLSLNDLNNELVFFFGLNQTDSHNQQVIETGQGQNKVTTPITATDIDAITRPVEAQDMLIWVRMLITDTAGNLVPGTEFYLSGGGIENPAGPDAANPVNGAGLADPQWVHVHGSIVVDATTGAFLRYGSDADPNQNEKVVDQNLGDQQAAFAVFNQTLSDKVRQLPSDYVFKMDLRYAFNTNGNETIWAQATDFDRAVVPEVTSFGIWGVLGLVGVGISRWRRRRSG